MELVKNLQNQKLLKNLIIVILGTLLLTLSAKIKIPFYPVPMTMQTFVVLLIGISFSYKIAVSIVGLYLIEGILGLPVFSNSPEKGIGLVYFTGPTMGYLIGFLFASYLAGYFNYNKNYLLNFFKLLLSVSFIYLFGILWLGNLIGWEKPVFKLGAKPFLLAELFKVLILTFLAKKLSVLRKFI
ncbi:MAG: biotin transporter BioY [Candidatus Pelagibacter sp.]